MHLVYVKSLNLDFGYMQIAGRLQNFKAPCTTFRWKLSCEHEIKCHSAYVCIDTYKWQQLKWLH